MRNQLLVLNLIGGDAWHADRYDLRPGLASSAEAELGHNRQKYNAWETENLNRSDQRIKLIRERIEAALLPEALELTDESYLHRGHEGARDGHGHFRLMVVSAAFDGKSRVMRHRLIYQALGDLMKTDIHALAIEAWASEEI